MKPQLSGMCDRGHRCGGWLKLDKNLINFDKICNHPFDKILPLLSYPQTSNPLISTHSKSLTSTPTTHSTNSDMDSIQANLPVGYVVWGQVEVGGQAQYIATPLVDGVATAPVPGQPIYLVPVMVVPQQQQRAVKMEAGVVKRQRKPKAVTAHATSICSNCHTTQTTLWRRNPSGEPECK